MADGSKMLFCLGPLKKQQGPLVMRWAAGLLTLDWSLVGLLTVIQL